MAQSSDEDEFASNFDTTTTPFRAVKVSSNDTKTTKPKSNTTRSVAGPSKPSSRGKRRRTPTPPREEEEEEEVEEIAPPVEKKPKRTAKATKPPSSGHSHQRQASSSSKSKVAPVTQRGKGRQDTEHGSRTEDAAVLESVREVRTEAESEAEIPHARPTAARQAAKGRREVEVKNQKEERLQRQIELLRKQLEQTTSIRDAMAQQLDEALAMRTTEAEELAAQERAQYEARLKTQEEMIAELTSQLARTDSLTREGKTSTLHFLTREAADEERRGLETELAHLRASLRDKDQELAAKDAQIRDREDTIQTLRSDLRAEIENTKAIMSRTNNRDPPSSTTKNKPTVLNKQQDPKHALTIRLYEDLTNLLVMNVKADIGKIGANTKIPDETVYKCVFTAAGSRSLTFDLRYYTGTDDDGETVENVLYAPMQLENEPDQEFVQSLGMLADTFTFNRQQMDEFFKQLRIIVGGEDEDGGEEA